MHSTAKGKFSNSNAMAWHLTEVLPLLIWRQSLLHLTKCDNYASLSSGEAYRDRQLTTNFELWFEIFCVPTCFHVRIPKLFLSVRTPRKKKSPCVNISLTLVIDKSLERSSQVLQHGNPKILIYFQKKVEIEFLLLFFICFWKAEINIQVGLNIQLYDDIGDAIVVPSRVDI